MPLPPAAVSVALYGRVAWIVDGERTPVVGGRPAELLAMLAVRQPDWVSADSLIDELWQRPPASGANALQRHVSRLRRQLAEVAGCDARELIEWSSAGYRLAPVVGTDLAALDAAADPGSTDGPVTWWAPPVAGVDPDRSTLAHRVLSAAADRRRHRWFCAHRDGRDADRALAWLLARAPHWLDDPVALPFVLGLAEQATDPANRRRVGEHVRSRPLGAASALEQRARSLMSGSRRGWFDLRRLGPCGSAVLDGDVSAAFDALDRLDLPDDVVARVTRWLVWAPGSDGFTQAIWREVIGLPPTMQLDVERCGVTLDAFAIEHQDDPVAVADASVTDAGGIDDLERALRVRFMVGLGVPISVEQHRTVDRLADLDHPVAQVEAPRFAAILAAKRARPVEAASWLDTTEVAIERLWPSTVDDVASLFRRVLHARWPDIIVRPDVGLLPTTVNHETLDLGRLTHLALDDAPAADDEQQELDDLRRHGHRYTRHEAARAFDLLTARRCGRRSEAAAIAEEMAPVWLGTTSNRHRHIGLVALGLEAEDRGDRDAAESVADALEPWRDEMLGIWPLDVLIGPADVWIERFAAV